MIGIVKHHNFKVFYSEENEMAWENFLSLFSRRLDENLPNICMLRMFLDRVYLPLN